jgi:uncharacterized membrane protein
MLVGMPCSIDVLKEIPLFSLLDDDEMAVLAGQVELREFAARQKIYKIGDPGERAYVLVNGHVHVTTVDEDHQEVLVADPEFGEFFGFASMMTQTAHQTSATALEPTTCVEMDRNDIVTLLLQKPHAGVDMMAVLARQFQSSQDLVRGRAARNANELIDEEASFGERIADHVAKFGGSWAFIISFFVILVVYSAINVLMGKDAWDPYPFILLNLLLSMLAAIQAPVIMMSQNRQDTKDRLRGELDYEVNVRSEAEIRSLTAKVLQLDDKLDDALELLREVQSKR